MSGIASQRIKKNLIVGNRPDEYKIFIRQESSPTNKNNFTRRESSPTIKKKLLSGIVPDELKKLYSSEFPTNNDDLLVIHK